MKELRAYLRRLLDTYAAQPDMLQRAVQNFSADQLHRPIEKGEWSPHQIVAHLAAAEQEALAPRLQRILDEDHPVLADWDETQWMEEIYDPERDVEEWLAQFEGARRELMPTLNKLELRSWNRTGRHPYRGERTLLWWVEYAVHHTREHLVQLGAEQT